MLKRIFDGKSGGGVGNVRSFGALMERGEGVMGKMCAPSAQEACKYELPPNNNYLYLDVGRCRRWPRKMKRLKCSKRNWKRYITVFCLQFSEGT